MQHLAPPPELHGSRPPPHLPRHDALGTFRVTAELLVAERPEASDDALRVAVRPGTWHAYVREEDDDADAALVLVHEAAVERVEGLDLDVLAHLADLLVEAPTVGALDAAALLDPAFAPWARAAEGDADDVYGDRGVAVTAPGEGPYRVLVDAPADARVVVVSF